VILQAKGTIEVTSKPGAGTSFHIYLPASSKPRGQSAPLASAKPHRGSGTILLVEDQREVRDFLVTVLSALGYRVLIPEAGGDPVSLCRAQQVDLLLTDVVMPRESGLDLARRVRTEFPGIRVLFMSGYLGEDHTAVNGALRDAAFLAKPFTPHALTEKIREVLWPRP
jgi:DNA-binding response OmpR family regulator